MYFVAFKRIYSLSSYQHHFLISDVILFVLTFVVV